MKHVPVLFEETMKVLEIEPGGRYVDGTLGRAGHARGMIERGAKVLGIDRDYEAVTEVKALGLAELEVVKGNHGDLAEIARSHGWTEVDGVLLDLGVSSPQLDEAERGFSFMREGPLDMRMDRDKGPTAADLVNGLDASELAAILKELGEEPRSRQIAGAIVKARAQGRIETTLRLAEIVERAVGGRRGAHHPATRTFQALRMKVNDELGELERALTGALELLKPGGRLAVITFESLSDRTVKSFFAAHAGREVSLQAGGSRWEGMLPKVKAVTRKAIKAAEEETGTNPRARSAKLRAVEKERV